MNDKELDEMFERIEKKLKDKIKNRGNDSDELKESKESLIDHIKKTKSDSYIYVDNEGCQSYGDIRDILVQFSMLAGLLYKNKVSEKLIKEAVKVGILAEKNPEDLFEEIASMLK